ncbi:unnamed protein product, partial [marine sediment metagenome]
MPPETDLANFIDVNILPEQYRPFRLPRTVIILSLVAAGLAVLILPLYLLWTGIRGDIAHLEADLQPVQEALAKISTPAPEVLELMNTLTQTQKSAGQLEEAYPSIVAARTDWQAVLAAIGSYDPAQLTL